MVWFLFLLVVSCHIDEVCAVTSEAFPLSPGPQDVSLRGFDVVLSLSARGQTQLHPDSAPPVLPGDHTAQTAQRVDGPRRNRTASWLCAERWTKVCLGL